MTNLVEGLLYLTYKKTTKNTRAIRNYILNHYNIQPSSLIGAAGVKYGK